MKKTFTLLELLEIGTDFEKCIGDIDSMIRRGELAFLGNGRYQLS